VDFALVSIEGDPVQGDDAAASQVGVLLGQLPHVDHTFIFLTQPVWETLRKHFIRGSCDRFFPQIAF
jgi:hypothetical protein